MRSSMMMNLHKKTDRLHFWRVPNIKPKARHRMVWEQVRQGRQGGNWTSYRSAPLSLCTLMSCMPGSVHLFLGLRGSTPVKRVHSSVKSDWQRMSKAHYHSRHLL